MSVSNNPSNEIAVSGKYQFANNEIAYNGNVFDCNVCQNNTSCCGTNDTSFSNNIPCIKCMCQSLYDVIDESRQTKVTMPSCLNCSQTPLTQKQCKDQGYLNNGLIQSITVYDCAQNVITSGSSNTLQGVDLQSTCATALNQLLSQGQTQTPATNKGSDSVSSGNGILDQIYNLILSQIFNGFTVLNFITMIILTITIMFVLLLFIDMITKS